MLLYTETVNVIIEDIKTCLKLDNKDINIKMKKKFFLNKVLKKLRTTTQEKIVFGFIELVFI